MPNGNTDWLSLDTDLLLSLGQNHEPTHLFRELALEEGKTLWATPQAIEEVRHKITAAKTAELRHAARVVWDKLIEWRIRPLRSGTPETARELEKLAAKLRTKGWLPELEYRDSMILAQTSLANIGVLVARDGHYHTDNGLLALSLEAMRVPVVTIADPRRLVSLWINR